MKEHEPWIPTNHVFNDLPLTVFDEREQQFLTNEATKIRNYRQHFTINYWSIAIRKTTQSIHTTLHQNNRRSIWLSDEAYNELHATKALRNHALAQVLNYQNDRYDLQGIQETGYEALDAIINDYKSFQDAIKHRATFTKKGFAHYARIKTREATNALTQNNPTPKRVRALRAAYIDSFLSGQHELITNYGIEQNTKLLLYAFRKLRINTNQTTPHEKLAFLEHLADLETNAIDLVKTYQEQTLRPPNNPRLHDIRTPPIATKKLAQTIEERLIEDLSEHHTTKRLNAPTINNTS